MIVFESKNVYEICKESQVKSYTESTMSSPSRILDGSCGLQAEVRKTSL